LCIRFNEQPVFAFPIRDTYSRETASPSGAVTGLPELDKVVNDEMIGSLSADDINLREAGRFKGGLWMGRN
jgi:hypothetical protein